MVNSFEVIFYSAVFIVPGYILYSTLHSLVPRLKINMINSTLRFLTATLIHYIMWSWLIYLMFNSDYLKTSIFRLYLSSFLIVVISPCLVGLLLAKLSDKNILIKILQKLGYSPINPIPTSWDYKFSNIPSKSWVIVSLKDGKVFYGKFSTESFASSESMERDFYIEDVYTLSNDKKWMKREKNDGVLILSDQIKYIEFFKN